MKFSLRQRALFSDSYWTIDNAFEDYQILLHEIEHFRRRFPRGIGINQRSSRGGWHSTNIAEEESFRPFFLSLRPHIAKISCHMGIDERLDYYINSAWININGKQHFNTAHRHTDCFLSGVYYVQVADTANGGELVFHHPDAKEKQKRILKEDFPTPNDITAIDKRIIPEQGLCVLFPSWIEHSVAQNNSSIQRISIAFNVAIRQKG